MKKGITTLFIILLLVVTSVVTPFSISADSDGCQTEVVTNTLSGHQYCMPDNIYNYGREQDKASYRAMVRTGNVGQDDMQLFDDWILSGENLRYSLLNRDLGGIVNNLSDRLGLYFKRIATGQMGRQGASVIRYLLGGDTYGSTSIMQAELESLPQSTNRNYYTGGTNNVYNSGDTNYYCFYNPDNRTFNINNTTYQITNNEYNFYTFESNYYTINNEFTFNYTYNIDNSVVNVIHNGATTTYTYYFRLPDGRNSYNLTEEDISGLKTDINISNYTTIDQSPNLLGLYHFDGNKKNVAYNGSDLFNISPNTITYVDSAPNFNQALYIGSRPETDPNIIYIGLEPSNLIDFRLFVSDSKEINLDFVSSDPTYKTRFVRKQKQVVGYVSQSTSTSNVITYNFQSTSSGSTSCPVGVRKGETISNSGMTGSYGTSTNVPIFNHTLACEVSVNTTTQVPVLTYEDDDSDSLRLDDYLRVGEWNSVRLTSYTSGDNKWFFILINGRGVNSNSGLWALVPNGQDFQLKLSGDGYFLIDELRILKTNESSGTDRANYTPSSTPFDDNVIYVLPDNVPSGTLLVQSDIPVLDTQIGGVRKTQPSKGDVFVLVNDVGFMQSLQQYDGSDWVEKKGAIYNESLGLWVSYYGYSIYTRNWDYTALSELSVDDIETQKDFYSWLGAQFNKLRTTIGDLAINITNNYNNTEGDDGGSSDLVQNIQNDNNVDIDVDINNVIGNVKNRDQNIDLTNPNYNLQSGNNLSAFEPLLRETIGVFNNNNLGWALFLPLVIAILGIVL